MNERIKAVADQAQWNFWQTVANCFPDAQTGDFPPEFTLEFDAACERAVHVWVDCNVPKVTVAASVCEGILTMEDGTTIDLIEIQKRLVMAFREDGDNKYGELAGELSEITGVLIGPHGEVKELT